VQLLEFTMRLLAVTACALSLASATAAAAQPAPAPQTVEDAHCLLAMVALSNASDATAQHFAQGGIIFFTGRLAARDPNFDFNRLKSMAATMDAQSAQTDLQRCGPMFQNAMKQLDTALGGPAAPPSTPPRK
jgi:hypothetical protein